MFEQHIREDILFCMFYAGVATLSMIASIYLLLRRGNAFAPGITTSVRLRRWTAALFAALSLSHVWYVPILYTKAVDDVKHVYFIGGLLDSMTVFPLAIIVLLTMLQDRRRPLWPVGVMAAPLVAGMSFTVARSSDTLLPLLYVYLLILGVGFIVYMLRALRQYGRWLRDNYADLEHKEVWQSFAVLASILLLFGIYIIDSVGPIYIYVVQVIEMVLVCYLLWRVETLSDLSIQQPQVMVTEVTATANDEIALLLKEHCVDTRLYLQHDLTLQQLAKAIGINRYYLSQYFSRQGTTYNAYINGLRIDYFVRLYHEAASAQRLFTTKQLAYDSGYRSYSTFSLAFKQRTGQNVTSWMRNHN
jgi:AraC-like DNA-binding protein